MHYGSQHGPIDSTDQAYVCPELSNKLITKWKSITICPIVGSVPRYFSRGAAFSGDWHLDVVRLAPLELGRGITPAIGSRPAVVGASVGKSKRPGRLEPRFFLDRALGSTVAYLKFDLSETLARSPRQ